MIEVEALTKYYGETKALDGVSFEVPRGQIVGFLGPNGAGKTTCMKILTGFISPTEGTARMAGHDVVDDSLRARARVGYLPEDTPLYLDMDVQGYLRFCAELRGVPASEQAGRLRHALETCGLRPRAGDIIGTLSKGYRQRVGLAQALLHTPEILIMDEPTDGLDPNQVVEIRKLIREIGQDRTVMLSTHHLAEVAAVCDRVLIIHEGRVVVDKMVDELKGNLTRVQFKPNGHDAEAYSTALAGLAGVSEVRHVGGQGDVLSFDVDAEGDADIRDQIFHLAVDKSWVLRELHHAPEQLEEVFRRATT
ncbi:MAG: ATP-binding cassette domain-containing protein [Planctomycetota bacterium]|nr:ATP-binding cassette domain-containing protein [Planctomycetota bacterium]